jgi:protein SCO1/2
VRRIVSTAKRCVLAVALPALVGVAAGCGGSNSGAPAAVAVPRSAYRGFEVKPPVRAPAFRLRDQAGRRIGPQSVRGHWLVIAFLYTHCPDVCPLIANNLGVAQRRVRDLRVLAVSVDPKRDTPTAVRRFIREHRLPAGFRFVTGSAAELAPVWKRYHVAAVPGPKATISHSAFELLVDRRGHERLLYDSKLRAADLLHDLRRLA